MAMLQPVAYSLAEAYLVRCMLHYYASLDEQRLAA